MVAGQRSPGRLTTISLAGAAQNGDCSTDSCAQILSWGTLILRNSLGVRYGVTLFQKRCTVCRFMRHGVRLCGEEEMAQQCTPPTVHQRNNSWLHRISSSRARTCPAYALLKEWRVSPRWSQS